MKKQIIAMATLVLVLSASMAFGQDAGEVYVFNNTSAMCEIILKVKGNKIGSGSVVNRKVAAGTDEYIEVFQQPSWDEDQEWYFQILSDSGKGLCDGYLKRSKNGFTPGVMGDCVTYSTFSPFEIKLSINK
ncbi:MULTISPECIES: hypothetical protein [unclassified Pseudodesulfovibrio]|uniref:hypothetical protein n=1 Tax=unclassified Pseudodesulfovibrio TaxID=2661612 RepID=UPI000FEB7826|nr:MULTISPECIES: hypothetical protein [unclassified Pseudodesulfovibrio]MCJ2165369.1 hypothetical protein [Pseudodesulfovibrio sp. S3-i]RWU02832.1 hypothetical protein DWB63_14355 [Pseudodesulfovibrio sp. S3]